MQRVREKRKGRRTGGIDGERKERREESAEMLGTIR
jgi:hypothetical protein